MWRKAAVSMRASAPLALLPIGVSRHLPPRKCPVERVDRVVYEGNTVASLDFRRLLASAVASALVLFTLVISGAGAASTQTISINFETSPGPDGILGTADDIATPFPCTACAYLSDLGYEAVGVNFTSGTLFAGGLFPDAGPANHYSSSTVPDATLLIPVYGVRLRSYSAWTVTLYAFDDAGSIVATDTVQNSSLALQLAELKVTSTRPIARFTVRPEGCSPGAPSCDRIVNID
ncbi:MAG: hypothetical protein JSW31_07330, partial [Burkholderiales bacterium]